MHIRAVMRRCIIGIDLSYIPSLCSVTLSSATAPNHQREANPGEQPFHESKTHPSRQMQRDVMFNSF